MYQLEIAARPVLVVRSPDSHPHGGVSKWTVRNSPNPENGRVALPLQKKLGCLRAHLTAFESVTERIRIAKGPASRL